MPSTDFDFFHGAWHVTHRRLKVRLAHGTEWDIFGGRCEVRPTLGGAGNVDDNVIDLPGDPYRAVTVRAHDAAQDQWTIWWLDGRHPQRMDTPMVGRFTDGVGLFLADDMLDGRPIRVRFRWSLPAPDAPRWEQAFSADGGATWEDNWVMDFRRIAAHAG